MSRPAKRQKTAQVEEVTFDPEARQEYLTGFHKRKQQRIKHAQEKAAEFEKEQKIKARKEIREQRRRDLEKHVETFNAMMKEAGAQEDSDNEGSSKEETDWQGFDGDSDHGKVAQFDGVTEPHEDEYVDEDKYTTVTVKPMGLNGEDVGSSEDDETSADPEDEGNTNRKPSKAMNKAQDTVEKKRVSTKDPAKPKKKRKKFRYENKEERKLSRSKERSRNSLAAKERRQSRK